MKIDLEHHNRLAYEEDSIVSSYRDTSIQLPESVIFCRYHHLHIANKNVLDIGCGLGRTTGVLAQLTDNVVGVDYSTKMVEGAKSLMPGIDFRKADVRSMPMFSDHFFDFILFAYNGIDYTSPQNRLEALKEIRRVLNPNGLFVFSTHNLRAYKRISPSLEWTINPIDFARGLRSYVTGQRAYKRNINLEVHEDDYSVICDNGNNYRFLKYYIDPKSQIQQLSNAGFSCVEVITLDGRSVAEDDDALASSAWVYYVCKVL